MQSATVRRVKRRSPPCSNCGSSLNERARYCSTCGQATAIVEFEASPDGSSDEPAAVTLGAPRRRVLVAVVGVGVAVLIVSVIVFNGGRSPSRSAPTSVPAPSPPTTGGPTPTTPTSEPPATTIVPVAQQVDPHAEAAGVVGYLATSHDDVVRVDLGTGTVQRRTGFDAANPHRGTWRPLGRKGGYVLLSPSDPRSHSILGVSNDPASTPAVLDGPRRQRGPGYTGRPCGGAR
jgi:hypothetical protein